MWYSVVLVSIAIGSAIIACYQHWVKDSEVLEENTCVVRERKNFNKLFVFRLCTFLCMITVEAFQYNREFSEVGHGGKFLLFFTVWNYHLQIVYFLLAIISMWVREDHLLHNVISKIFAVILPMSILVSVVLWGILAPAALHSGNKFQISLCFDATSYFQHAFNTLCILVDFSYTKFQMEEHHLMPFLFWVSFYVIFVWIQHTFTNFYPYFFMKLDSLAVLWYSALVGIHLLVFRGVKRFSDHKFDIFSEPTAEDDLAETLIF